MMAAGLALLLLALGGGGIWLLDPFKLWGGDASDANSAAALTSPTPIAANEPAAAAPAPARKPAASAKREAGPDASAQSHAAAGPEPLETASAPASADDYTPASMLTRPDQSIIRTAVNAVKKTAECNAEYRIGADGLANNIKPNCTLPDYDAYVVQYLSTAKYTPTMENGVAIESGSRTGLIQFDAPQVAAAAVEKAPVLVTPMQSTKEMANAAKGAADASCTLSYVVGTNGVPSNIVANCTPTKLNVIVANAAAKMRFQSGQRDGVPVSWPIQNHQMGFGTTKAKDSPSPNQEAPFYSVPNQPH
jgi:hypothetical protein